jgi:hypothetical protein
MKIKMKKRQAKKRKPCYFQFILDMLRVKKLKRKGILQVRKDIRIFEKITKKSKS